MSRYRLKVTQILRDTMAKLDLTLRELNEAQSYALSPEQYEELKQKLEAKMKERVYAEVREQAKKDAKTELRPEIATELRPGLRVDVEKELRPKITADVEASLRTKLQDELRPKIREGLLVEVRKQVEADLTTNLRATLRVELQREAEAEVPTVRERDLFRRFVRSEEEDCRIQARAASADAARSARNFAWGRWFFLPTALLMLAALPVLGYFLYMRFADGAGFWTILCSAIFVAFSLLIATMTRQKRLKEHDDAHRKIASDYWILAERAKKLRMIDSALVGTRQGVQAELDSYQRAKQQVDDRYLPDARSLDTARVAVRSLAIQEEGEQEIDRHLRVLTTPDLEEEDIETASVGVRRKA